MTFIAESFLITGLFIFGGLLTLILGSYLILFFMSHRWAYRHKKERENWPKVRDQDYPAVALIVPACNEQAVIKNTLRSLLALDYPNLSVWVVDDGSQDQTFANIASAYPLCTVQPMVRKVLSGVRPLEVFQSQTEPRLFVIKKPNSGKADSINSALQFIPTKLFAICDADSEVMPHALKFLAHPFLTETQVKKTVAVGALIRVNNKSSSHLVKFQRLEYLRAFFAGRLAWNFLENIYMISGAFGVYDTESALKVGGIPTDSRTEDLDFCFRLHRYHLEHEIPYRMLFYPDTLIATHVPEKLAVLERQRWRWHRGLIETLWMHKSIFLKPQYETFGTLVQFFLWICEGLSSLIEVGAFVFLVACAVLGIFSWGVVLKVFIIGLILAWIINTYVLLFIASVRPEEMLPKFWKDLVFAVALENFIYRPWVSWIRIQALFPSKKHPKNWRVHLQNQGVDQR